MSDPTPLLQQLGFGEYEARAYVALVRHSAVSGYELAKVSGIPRANIYAVLQKLEERGAVLRLDTPAGVRYAAVAPAVLTQQMERQLREVAAAARQRLDAITSPAQHHYVWNVRGYDRLVDHARRVIAAAQERLLVALRIEEADVLAEALAEAERRGVAITTLCLADCATPCGGCRGLIYQHRVPPTDGQRWFLLVADGAEVVAAEAGSDEETLTVRTRQPLLVELAGRYIPQSIALAAVLSELAAEGNERLSEELRSLLLRLGVLSAEGGVVLAPWLARDGAAPGPTDPSSVP